MDGRTADRPARPKFEGAVERVTIDVFEGPSPQRPFVHRWWLNDNDDHKSSDEIITLPPGTGPYVMTFNLRVPGLSFAGNSDDPADAMWVRAGGHGCPTKKGNGKKIYFIKRSDDRLAVWNDNQGAETHLHYMLRFDDGSGHVREFDPIIKNFGRSNLTGNVLKGAVAVGFLALLYRELSGRDR